MNFNIVEKRKIWFTISLLVIIAGLLAMPINALRGKGILNFDIEFIGGTLMHINIGQEFDTKEDITPIVTEITGDDSPQVTKVVGKNEVIIKTKSIDTATRTELYNALKEKYNLDENEDLLTVDDVSPTISTEMQVKALKALFLSSILMLIYISFRFKDWKFGLSAVMALLHDVLIVFSVYSIARIAINNSFVAAILTIVGYSINDTIVVFDRIRENRKVARKGDRKELINRSISQTISRSINTSLTTLVTITILYFLGVPSIKEFALPIMVGIITGTYSSIFIASPLWYVLRKKEA
ncbi:protein translocase subunit SecF [Defluviitalea phaphyphila]|uniref:protein translocase subunit SecF n=1 Tax=Defluviitalea phaphyphila TaxID=1473580 RepID=UPI000730137C|nr:protein translocase subunit SecF [Defluviitalea phaphyphila]